MASTVPFTSANVTGLWAPLHGLFGFLASRTASKESQNLMLPASPAHDRDKPSEKNEIVAQATTPRRRLTVRPLTSFLARPPRSADTTAGHAPPRLRVLREFEAGTSPSCAGRMFISGRMADVCAELERMSGAEGAPH